MIFDNNKIYEYLYNYPILLFNFYIFFLEIYFRLLRYIHIFYSNNYNDFKYQILRNLNVHFLQSKTF